MTSLSSKLTLLFALFCAGCVPDSKSPTIVTDQVRKLIESQAKLKSVQLSPDGGKGYFGSALDKDGRAWNITVTPQPNKPRSFDLKLTDGKLIKWGWIVVR